MKRKLLVMSLMVLAIGSSTACNSDNVNITENIENVTEVVETTSEVVETISEIETASIEDENNTTPEIEEIEQSSEMKEEDERRLYETGDKRDWDFSTGAKAVIDKYMYMGNENWSFFNTYFDAVEPDGMDMHFVWEGPTLMGARTGAGKSTLVIWDVEKKYQLNAWGCEVTSIEEDALRAYDKETVVGWDAENSTYTEGDYYEFVDGDIEARVTFKVSSTIDGVGYTGYNCYFENYETMICYQMSYLEENSIYDDERAMKVINSIDFWDEEDSSNVGDIAVEGTVASIGMTDDDIVYYADLIGLSKEEILNLNIDTFWDMVKAARLGNSQNNSGDDSTGKDEEDFNIADVVDPENTPDWLQ